jgi:AmpE protein
MKFLAVLLIVFLYRNWLGDNPVREKLPFEGYAEWFRNLSLPPRVGYLLCVGLPVLVVLLISIEFSHGFILSVLWLVLSLAVLAYAIEMHDNDIPFDQQADWLDALVIVPNESNGPAENAENEASEEPDANTDAQGLSLEEATRRQSDFQIDTVYEIFQSLHPALLWFMILGPAGTLAYVLTQQYLDHLEDDDPETDFVLQVVYWMEWPAVRITGLIFALFGNFGTSLSRWLDSLFDVSRANSEVLVSIANSAVSDEEHTTQGGFVQASRDSNEDLRQLMERTLYGWLGFAALLTIIGW